MNDDIELDEAAPWLMVFITLLGGFLRALMLSDKGMWLDETFSVWLASRDIPEMLQWIVQIDQHPPLYYLLLHFWIKLNGASPYDVRLISVIFGMAAIPVIYLIGKRMAGVTVGLAAAVFLAVSPFHIYYGQETRMYTLLTFNAAVAMYALVWLLTDPRSARPIGSQLREYCRALRTPAPPPTVAPADFTYGAPNHSLAGRQARLLRRPWPPIQSIQTDLAWLTWIIFSAATLYSHNAAVLFPLAANLFVLGWLLLKKLRKAPAQPGFSAPPFWNWAASQAGTLLLWSPWIRPFIQQAAAVDERFWMPAPTWQGVLQVMKTFINASAPLPAGMATTIWALFGAGLILGLVYYRQKGSQLAFLAALFAVPILAELLVSIRRPIFFDRTLIWVTIPLFLLLASGIAQLKYRFLMIGALGILAAINLFSASDYYRFYQKEDWATPAGYVANFAQPGDLVLFNSNFVEVPFNYYFESYESLYSIQVKKLGFPRDLLTDRILEPEMTASEIPALLSLTQDHPRIWLVYSHNDYTDPAGLIPQTLAAQMKLTRTRDFNGGRVQLYQRP